MRHRLYHPVGTLGAIVAAAWLCTAPAAAEDQTPAKTSGEKAKAWTVPRTPWGDPDLEGIWPGTQILGIPLERPKDMGERTVLNDQELAQREAQVQRLAAAERGETVGAPRPFGGPGPPAGWTERGTAQRQASLVVFPPNGRVPAMLPQAEKRIAALPHNHFYDNSGQGPFDGPEDMSLWDRCISLGVVGSTLPLNYNAGNQIVQTPGYVAILYEMIHETRIIPLDGHPHVGPQIRSYMGDARGHWEGTTLVIETTNFNGKAGMSGRGRENYATAAVKLVERFNRVSDDTIEYEVTIADPTTWTIPWKIAFPLKRDQQYGMYEYACHEGNDSMAHILSGARTREKLEQD